MLDGPIPVIVPAETYIQDMDTCFRRYDEEERTAESSQEGRARVATSIGRPRDFPNPKFVEPVETNPEVTPAFAPTPRPFDKLKDLPRRPNPKFVELVETNPEVTSAFAPTPGPLTMTTLLGDVAHRYSPLEPPSEPCRFCS